MWDLSHQGDLNNIRRTRPSKYANLRDGQISLGLGESDFEMPKEVKEAMIEAINEGRYHYEFGGVPEFLEAAKDKLRRQNGIDVDEDHILPIAGGMNGIWLMSRTLLKAGDRVMVITPNYPPLISNPRDVSGAEVIELRAKDDFHLDLEAIRKAVFRDVRAILICNPNNPTGAVYSGEELGELADVAKRHGIYVFSDELYEDLTYDGTRHVSIASIVGMLDTTITVFAFTKTYGMSGLRIGYLVAEKAIIKRMREENDRVLIQPGTIEQIGAAAALKRCQHYVASLRKYLEEARSKIVKRLNEVQGVDARLPEGTYYVFPDISQLFDDDEKAVRFLEREANVRVSGGKDFGNGGKGHIRINFCSPWPILEEAIEKICNALSSMNT